MPAIDVPLYADRNDRPLIIAHRGVPGRAPENTLSSFRLALADGADGIELDVHLSRDGVPVVLHDPTIDRTTAGSGRVDALTVAELQAVPIRTPPGGPERIPTLQEVLQMVPPSVFLNIEIKAPPAAPPGAEERADPTNAKDALVGAVMATLNAAGWGPERYFISSFDHALLRLLVRRYPEVAVAALTNGAPEDVVALPGRIVNPKHTAVTPEWAAMARRMGRQIFPWTANDSNSWRALAAAGVSGIITDKPGELRNMLVLS